MMLTRSLAVLIAWLTLAILPASAALSQQIVVRPAPATGPLNNPLKGWCPYTDAGDIDQPYSMVFQYVSWRELEPRSGDYQFEKWEQRWDEGLGRDKHVIFRVYVDYPSLPSGLPDWLRQAGIQETAYQDYGGGNSPDYNDPKMVEAMERLIQALGRRYNENPRIAFIQLGLLGLWGEWHTYPREELYASAETEKRIIDAYHKAFPDKKLMVRYARDYAGQQDWIGFHDDMFPEDTDNGADWSFLSGLRREKQTNNWQRSVVGGEMVPNKAKQILGNDFDNCWNMVQKTQFTWVGPYCPALEKSMKTAYLDKSQKLVRSMGYNFQITEVTHAATAQQQLPIRFQAINTGVAPFYYPWTVEWALLDRQGKPVKINKTDWDIREWLPGKISEAAELELSVPAGEYQLAIGIRDPWKDRPAIEFANDLPIENGWTVVSKIVVE